ncbi:MAG: TonB-dependent receptor [Bryobacteraceae bacterium]|nr:TonB-dependent receptor [Bryobacteraceae bacterium]
MTRTIALLTLAASASAQQLSVRGTVTDEGKTPLAGISLALEPGGRTAVTDSAGAFTVENVAPGSYLLTATGRGFVPWQETVRLSSANATVAIRMATVQTAIEVREAADDFLATASVSVTKSPQSLIDLPYAVQVIPKALLDSRAIQEIKDLYRNISGMTDSPYSAMTFRGFTQREILFNGVRGNPYGSLENDINDAGFSTSQGRLSNIEFVEVLRGPAAVLFGVGEPGGVVNFVTKKPRTQTAGEASFRTGSFRQLGGHAEVTGPLWKKKNLFYRAAWFQEDRKIFRWNARNENVHLATGLSWRMGEATSLGFEYEYIDQLLPGHRLRGIPVNPAGGNLTIREWVANEPDDFSALQARVFQTRLDHAFTPTLRTDVSFRFLNYDRPERYHEPRGLNPDGRTMRREFRNQFRANDDWSLTANGYQRWAPKNFGTHNFVFGVESVRQDWLGRYGTNRERERGGPVPGVDLFAPVYGLTSGLFYPTPPFTLQTVASSRTGIFLQDQIEILPRWQVLLGGRVERFADNGRAETQLDFRATAWTGRIGTVYRLLPKLSAFGSFSNGYIRPPALAQTPAANGPHEAENSYQLEGGFKSEFSQGRVLMTASAFRIEKRNVLRPDPNFGPGGDNFAAVLPVGKVRNQGFEVDATGRVTKDLSIVVNYAFLDSTILEDRFTPSAVGRSMPNAARHAFGLFARYDIAGSGTAISVGNESRSRRYEPYAGFSASGYGIWDFGLFQRIARRVELRLQLDNAWDRVYATASLFAARAGNWPGTPRTFTASIHFFTQPR